MVLSMTYIVTLRRLQDLGAVDQRFFFLPVQTTRSTPTRNRDCVKNEEARHLLAPFSTSSEEVSLSVFPKQSPPLLLSFFSIHLALGSPHVIFFLPGPPIHHQSRPDLLLAVSPFFWSLFSPPSPFNFPPLQGTFCPFFFFFPDLSIFLTELGVQRNLWSFISPLAPWVPQLPCSLRLRSIPSYFGLFSWSAREITYFSG